MGIDGWPESERPRERLLRGGAAVLSDAELLAILLRTGVAGRSAVDLARDLIAEFGSIRKLLTAPFSAVRLHRGVGEAKFVQFQAVLELGRRALIEEMTCADLLNSPSAVRNYLSMTLGDLALEVFHVMFLNSQNRLIASEELTRGTVDQAAVYPREVARRALVHNAVAVTVAHNHPSGTVEPSRADLALTQALKATLGVLEIRLLDHVIVAGAASLSFAERGLL